MENTFYSVDGMLNRRDHLRNECSIGIEMEDPMETLYHGCLKNLCPGGAYIEAVETALKKNQNISLTIPFQKTADFVTVKARVAWLGSEGFGVAFIRNKRDQNLFDPIEQAGEKS